MASVDLTLPSVRKLTNHSKLQVSTRTRLYRSQPDPSTRYFLLQQEKFSVLVPTLSFKLEQVSIWTKLKHPFLCSHSIVFLLRKQQLPILLHAYPTVVICTSGVKVPKVVRSYYHRRYKQFQTPCLISVLANLQVLYWMLRAQSGAGVTMKKANLASVMLTTDHTHFQS